MLLEQLLDVFLLQSVSLSGGLSLDRLVRARRVAVGPVAAQEIDVQIYAPTSHAPAPSGLLGVSFLRPYRVGLDLPGRRLVLVRPGVVVVPRAPEQR